MAPDSSAMASPPTPPATDQTANRPIPLVALRRPTLDASSSTSLDSSTPTTSPSTPASLTPPTSAIDSSSTSSPERLSRQTTCVSCSSTTPGASPDPSSNLQPPPPIGSSDIPRSVPDGLEQQPPNLQRQTTWLSFIQPWDHRRTWVQNSIGIAGLAVALVGMFVYALRGYKMAKWTEYNDLLQTCASLVQAEIDGGPRCKKILEDGPRERPYDKRHIQSWLPNIRRIGAIHSESGPPLGFLIACVGIVCLSTLLLHYLRRRSRTQAVFQSPVRSEGSVRVTHHHPDGPLIDDSRGPIQIRKHQPGCDFSVRRRIKQKAHDKKSDVKSKISWKPTTASSSATTLIGGDAEPDKVHEEHHDGLIELKQTDGTRNFLDPETGETLHLSPWKSTHDSSEEEDDEEPFEKLDKGTIQRKLTEMSIGSAMLGGGMVAEKSLQEKAQAEAKAKPQQVGDSLASLVTNESSSIKEAFK